MAIFRLVGSDYRKKKPDLYVRLENNHNGFYGHGFTFKGAEIIKGIL